MIRFVVAPDGLVVPDVSERLPGRGIWLTASRSVIERAVAKHSFAKAARAAVRVAPALADDVERLLARRCVETLGLARRAGSVVIGYEQVTDWLQQGRVAVLLAARDAAENQRRRLVRQAGEACVIACLERGELGRAFGREAVTYAAVAPGGLVETLTRDGERLSGMRGEAAVAGGDEEIVEEEDEG